MRNNKSKPNQKNTQKKPQNVKQYKTQAKRCAKTRWLNKPMNRSSRKWNAELIQLLQDMKNFNKRVMPNKSFDSPATNCQVLLGCLDNWCMINFFRLAIGSLCPAVSLPGMTSHTIVVARTRVGSLGWMQEESNWKRCMRVTVAIVESGPCILLEYLLMKGLLGDGSSYVWCEACLERTY